MSDISRQGQSIFQPVDLKSDIEEIMEFLCLNHGLLLIKSEPPQSPKDITFASATATAFVNEKLIATMQDGPLIPIGQKITVQFEVKAYKYFTMGKILESKNGTYTLGFDKIHRLQRRNSFRVKIHSDVIPAQLEVLGPSEDLLRKKFSVGDLSIGGAGVIADSYLERFFVSGQVLTGILRVGKFPELTLQFMVKYKRPIPNKGVSMPPNQHIGCEFYKLSAAHTDQISFLVNECHRQIFLRSQARS